MLKSEQYDIFCRLFRALRTQQNDFSQYCIKGMFQLEQIFNDSLKKMEQILRARHQVYKNQIQKLYDLSKEVSKVNSESQHFNNNQFSKSYEPIIKWFKCNKQSKISDYAQLISKQNILKYQQDFNKMSGMFTTVKDYEDISDSNPTPEKQKQPETHRSFKRETPDAKPDSPNNQDNLVRQILQLPKDMIEKVMQQVKKISLKQEHSNNEKRKKKKRNKQLIKEVGKTFSAGQREIHFKYLPNSLRQKLGSNKEYQFIVKSTLAATAKYIEITVQIQLGFRRMSHTQRQTIYTDLKNYQSWMSKEDAQLFLKAYVVYNELDPTIEISKYQIYVLYILMINKYLENLKVKAKKNKIQAIVTQNESPKNIRKEITFLYFHYDNLERIKSLFKERYYLDPTITSEYLDQEFKSVLVEAYHRISREQSIQNKSYEHILMKMKDFNNEPWPTIATLYIRYQLSSKLQETQKDLLKQAMKMIVTENEAKNPNKEIKTKRSKDEIIIPYQNVEKKSMILNFKLENKERRQQIIHRTKVIKLEEDSSSEAQSVDS